ARGDGEALALALGPGVVAPGHQIEGDVDHVKELALPIGAGCDIDHAQIVLRIEVGEFVRPATTPRRAEEGADETVAIDRVHGEAIDIDPPPEPPGKRCGD